MAVLSLVVRAKARIIGEREERARVGVECAAAIGHPDIVALIGKSAEGVLRRRQFTSPVSLARIEPLEGVHHAAVLEKHNFLGLIDSRVLR